MIKVLSGPTIAAGQSLSDELDCTAGQITRIVMPANWSNDKGNKSPPLTFQISADNATWNDLFDMSGFEVTVPTVVPGSAVIVQPTTARQVWIKFRSGSRAAPVNQGADCVFNVALETGGGGGAGGMLVWCYVPGYGWMWLNAVPPQ